MSHPCRTCGACCATWSVVFERRELTAALRPHVVDPKAARLLELRTSEAEPSRCAALEGPIGGQTTCGIYRHRPSPCRDVQASYERGVRDASCHEARERHGLAPLTPRDWA